MQRMDRLRRSLRDSFRRKREAPESSKPHQWQADEEAVRAGNCIFTVKYLGCVEVFESRGMQVCEEAMKVLRQSRRRPVKSVLHVSGDGLRVVEDDTKGLIVDQTIEKVSFCAPDRNHERGFSYICRDGTTRRWMCHGFLSGKDSGERLSHAVGCAFAACLERKQKREKECGVSMTYDPRTSTFTRSGSFRVGPITEQGLTSPKSTSPPPVDGTSETNKPSVNPHAIERPHASAKMLERQGSFRGFPPLANRSPFKRQLSLRLNELPSNLQRTQPNSIDILTNNNITIPPVGAAPPPGTESPTPPPRTQRNRLHSLPNTSVISISGVIPESSLNGIKETPPLRIENKDLVSELCQQVTQGLSMLAANHDDVSKNGVTVQSFQKKFTNPWDSEVGHNSSGISSKSNMNSALPVLNTSGSGTNSLSSKTDGWLNNLSMSQAPKTLLQSKIASLDSTNGSGLTTKPNIVGPASPSTSCTSSASAATSSSASPAVNENQRPARPPLPTQLSQVSSSAQKYRALPPRSQSLGADPFDADWATPAARTGQTSTNPFVRQQTFQVSM